MPRVSGTARGLIFIVLALVTGIWILPEVDKVLFAPWALEWTRGATPLGTWEGPLQARLGAEYHLLLELQYQSPGSEGDHETNLKGTARLCTPSGDTYDYTLTGSATRSGTQLRVSLRYGDPQRSALAIGWRGTWHADTVRLERASDNPFLPNGVFDPRRISRSTDPDDAFQATALHHGTAAAFVLACTQLHAHE